jgi:hypothetical protein
MAFPATYDFNYYRGDTYQFVVRPKNANNAAFPLDNYTSGPLFSISNYRGPAKSGISKLTVSCSAEVDTIQDIVTCTITPIAGNKLTAGVPYYYDVQVKTTSGSVLTLITGTITVTDDVSDTQAVG